MERQQNYRHNRSMRVLLPGFALKWGVLTAMCFSLGGIPAPVVLTACFFVTGTWTLVVCLLIITSWCWLETLPRTVLSTLQRGCPPGSAEPHDAFTQSIEGSRIEPSAATHADRAYWIESHPILSP